MQDLIPFAPDAAPRPDRRRVFTVAELTRSIKETLEDTFGLVWVEGEISNLRQPASGHCYFTLKDESAQLSAVLFRGNQRGLPCALKDGSRIRVHGELTVYEARGNYQILVRQVEEAGKGSLLEQFEILKKKLAAEGLFDPSRKQVLPMLPRRLSVLTYRFRDPSSSNALLPESTPYSKVLLKLRV